MGSPVYDAALPVLQASGKTLDSRHLSALEVMADQESEAVRYVTRLATTGSPISRKHAQFSLYKIVVRVADAYRDDEGSNWSPWRAAYERTFARDSLMRMKNVRRWRQDIQSKWSIENVRYELGEDRIRFSESDMRELFDLMERRVSVDEDEFWRGVTVLRLSTKNGWFSRTAESNRKFIDWAGKHEDIGSVITVAKERSTLDIEAIQQIINEQQQGHAVLGSGVL